MAIRGAEYAVTRMIATLQTYLPAELDLIDAEEADFVLDDVENGHYYDFADPRVLVNSNLAIVVNVSATTPLAIKSTTNSPGVYDVEHTIEVAVHKKGTENEGPATMKKRVLRYARGIERVLAIKYPTLPGGGVETVVMARRFGDVTYIDTADDEGRYTRTARVPFLVHTYEAL